MDGLFERVEATGGSLGVESLASSQLEIAEHDGEQVVEVMGDTTGEHAEALELLGLTQRLFLLALSGDVSAKGREADDVAVVPHGLVGDLVDQRLPIRAFDASLLGEGLAAKDAGVDLIPIGTLFGREQVVGSQPRAQLDAEDVQVGLVGFLVEVEDLDVGVVGDDEIWRALEDRAQLGLGQGARARIERVFRHGAGFPSHRDFPFQRGMIARNGEKGEGSFASGEVYSRAGRRRVGRGALADVSAVRRGNFRAGEGGACCSRNEGMERGMPEAEVPRGAISAVWQPKRIQSHRV